MKIASSIYVDFILHLRRQVREDKKHFNCDEIEEGQIMPEHDTYDMTRH